MSVDDFGIIGVLSPDYATYCTVKAALRTIAIPDEDVPRSGYSRFLSIVQQAKWLEPTTVAADPQGGLRSERAPRKTILTEGVRSARAKTSNAGKMVSSKVVKPEGKGPCQLSLPTFEVDKEKTHLSVIQIPTTLSGVNNLRLPTPNQLNPSPSQRVALSTKSTNSDFEEKHYSSTKPSETAVLNKRPLSAAVIESAEQLTSQILPKSDIVSDASWQIGDKERPTLPAKLGASRILLFLSKSLLIPSFPHLSRIPTRRHQSPIARLVDKALFVTAAPEARKNDFSHSDSISWDQRSQISARSTQMRDHDATEKYTDSEPLRDPAQRLRFTSHNETVPSQVHVPQGGNSSVVGFHVFAGHRESSQETQQIVAPVGAPVLEHIPPTLPELPFNIPRTIDKSRPLSIQSPEDLARRYLDARQKGRKTYHKSLWTFEPMTGSAPPDKEYFSTYFDGQLVEGIRLVHGEAMKEKSNQKVCIFGCLHDDSHRWLSNSKCVSMLFFN